MKVLFILLFPISLFCQMETIDVWHKEIHEGHAFNISCQTTVSAAYGILIVPTNSTKLRIHMSYGIEASSSGKIERYDSPKCTNSNATFTYYNRNGNATAYTGYVRIFTNATAHVTNNGTIREIHLIGQSNVQGQTRIGGGARPYDEFIIKTNTAYWLLFTPDYANTVVNFNISYYFTEVGEGGIR